MKTRDVPIPLAASAKSQPVRVGWAEAARRIAEQGDDELVMGEFANSDDAALRW